MALDLNKIRAIQHSIDSPNETETRRRYARQIVERDYFKSLDVDKFLMFNQGLTDTEYWLNVYDRDYSHYDGVEQKFTCPIKADVEAGDMLYDPAKDEYWLVQTSNPVDYIYRKGKMILCDTFIKWQDDEGNIWEYPVADNNTTQYNSGIYQGKLVDYVTSQHRLSTVCDANVCNLKIDMRFFLGKVTSIPEVFRLTQIDTTSLGYGKSIAQLTVLRSTYNPETDDITTGICHMKETVDETPDEHTGNISINFDGEPIIYIGKNKIFTADIPSCSWGILEPEAAAALTLTAVNSNTVEVSAPITTDTMALEGETFTLICDDGSGNTSTQLITIIGGA